MKKIFDEQNLTNRVYMSGVNRIIKTIVIGVIIVIALFIVDWVWAEELPTPDCSEYEVGKFYEDTGLITWMSEDKRKMRYIQYVPPQPSQQYSGLSILKEIRNLLKNKD